MKNHLLIIAIGFLPNIGGLETHLKDLIDELIKQNWRVTVLTYQPLNTPALGQWIEKEKNLIIFRLPVLRGLFYRLLKNPFFEFLYLGPSLFLITPLIVLKYPDIKTVNAQGIIAGFSAAFWSKIFKKRYVISVQSVYHFPKKGWYRQISRWIFKSADKVIAISKQAKQDVESLGISSDKIQLYTNWENSNFFKPLNKEHAKSQVGLAGKFVVSFFGRLIEEKGVKVLLDAIKQTSRKITFAIYGEGPLEGEVKKACQENKNIVYMGIVPPKLLPLHYSAADLIVMPTLNQEGFGRVAAGALFCKTPVVVSNRGALPEVVSSSVGRVIEPTPINLRKEIEYFFVNKIELKKCSVNARNYATKKFGSANSQIILDTLIGVV